jgi:N,N'-diacetyllegionaminate synthase
MNPKTYIIAEIAQGFEGNPWLCKKYIELAKKSGADAVKFQIFKADELATPDYQYYNLFRSLEIAPEVWNELIDYANEIGIDFLSDIYGTETLEWISKTKLKGIKIHSTDIMNYPLLEAVRNKPFRIFLSVGGSKEQEITHALRLLQGTDVILLSGFQAEPNLIEDLELDKIELLKKLFGTAVGYADHIDAASKLALVIPPMAVLKGASVIEKHLTIDRQHLQLEDYVSALNPEEFAHMVELIRNIEAMPNNDCYMLSERETAYRDRTKRSIVMKHDKNKGELIIATDIQLIRTGNKGDFFDMNEVVGKPLKVDVKKGHIIKFSDLA